MIHGSCLCGQIRYQLDGGLHLINNCHCSMCRKAHGAAFGTFLHADAGGFRWLAGADLVTNYRSSSDSVRAFCSVCGSNMPVLFAGIGDEPGEVIIPAGTLDDDPRLRPIVHIFSASKAPWHEITDEITQFEGFPSDEWMSQYEEKGGFYETT